MSSYPPFEPPGTPRFGGGRFNGVLRALELIPAWLLGLLAVGVAAILAFVAVTAFGSTGGTNDGRGAPAAVVTPSNVDAGGSGSSDSDGAGSAAGAPPTSTPDDGETPARALTPSAGVITNTDGDGVRWREACDDDAPSLTEEGFVEGEAVVVGGAGTGLCVGWLLVRPASPAAGAPSGPAWVREEFVSLEGSATPSATATASPTGSPTATPSPTASPSPSPSPTATPSPSASPTASPTPDEGDLASETAAAALAVQANALASLEAALIDAHAGVFDSGLLSPARGVDRAGEIRQSAAGVAQALRVPGVVPDGADSDCEHARESLAAAASALEGYATLEASLFEQGSPDGPVAAQAATAAAVYRGAFNTYLEDAAGCVEG